MIPRHVGKNVVRMIDLCFGFLRSIRIPRSFMDPTTTSGCYCDERGTVNTGRFSTRGSEPKCSRNVDELIARRMSDGGRVSDI